MANFIPPIDLGQFTPSAAALSSWLYQIWKYLQENPITDNETIQEDISTTVTEAVPGAVDDYMTEHPVEVPVISVNNMIGAVVLAYNNLVGDGSTLPIYRAATGETSNNDLLEAWAEGCRFLLVDDTTPYMMIKNVNQGAETIALVPLSGGGGGGGGDVSSVNGQTGAVILTYTDFVGVSSTLPILLADNDEISNNDLITAWNNGYRFAVFDGTEPYIIMRSGNTASLLPIGTPVTSVNGQTGAVTLTYPDINPSTSSVPLLISSSMPSAADLLTAYNAGNRFLLVNNGNATQFYGLSISGSTVTANEIIDSSQQSSGGSYSLWENSSPANSFSAQRVTLSQPSSNFDLLMFNYTPSTTFTTGVLSTLVPPNSPGSMLMFSGGDNKSGYRLATITNSGNTTYIDFGGATYNTTANNNAFIIPYSVWGIKL